MFVRVASVLAASLVVAPALAQGIVVLEPRSRHVVVEPAPTISTTTRVACRPAVDTDFQLNARLENGVRVLTPPQSAYAAGRCGPVETSTTITRPLR
jgi:hypothetical protein